MAIICVYAYMSVGVQIYIISLWPDRQSAD